MADKKKPKETWKEKLATNWITNSIAILAFVISMVSLLKSCEANRISCEANKIAKTAELSYFKFSMNFNNSQDKILIYNEGGKIRELENPQIYLFWSTTSDKSLLNAKDMVVLNYYNLGSRDPLLSSKAPVTISAENFVKAETLIDGFKKLAKENNFLVSVSAKWYIRLRYKDIYDEPHDDMYDVSPIGARKMSKNEAMELIKKYNQMTKQGIVINMSTASPEILYGKWKD